MPKPSETLSDLFAPPPDSQPELYGVGGVVCAYSADPDFLEQALLRFTRRPPASRLAHGSVDLTLMLNPPHPALGPDAVPGLMVLRPKFPEHRPVQFSCMHAKVALLAFGPARLGSPTHFRLIVSTGNWTRASARHQIELVWRLDLDAAAAPKEDRYELFAVAEFLDRLMHCYQSGPPLTNRAAELLAHARAHALKPKADQRIRFLSSLSWRDKTKPASSWQQLAPRLAEVAPSSNYLVCGSGFYEQATDPADPPAVLSAITQDLRDGGGLTRSPTLRVVANADARDQVTACYRAGTLTAWELCRPKDPSPEKPLARSLHAKFLFVAKCRQDALLNSWLYLGSSNLSKTGFLLAPPYGNIEAGVLLETPQIDHTSKLSRFLPVGREFRDRELVALPGELPEAKEPGPDVPPCPILAFASVGGGLLGIKWDEQVPVGEVLVALPDGAVMPVKPMQDSLRISGSVPRCLEVRWDGHCCRVPCMDPSGEYQRQVLPVALFESWLDQLRHWNDADVADEEEPAWDDEPELPEVASERPASAVKELALGRDFPARTAMLLVEEIAECNGAIPPERGPDWLAYLRHLLLEQMPKEHIDGWRGLRVNFLRALLSGDGFAPDWPDLEKYQALIHEVSDAWGLSSSCPLEVYR